MIPSYYKKVDYSMLHWGFTLPKKFISVFEGRRKVKLGSSRSVEIAWNGDIYLVKLCNVKRTYKGKPWSNVYQLRWDMNQKLLTRLRKTFITSYVRLLSEKEKGKYKKHFRSKLKGGEQEVLILTPLSSKRYKLEVFIQIEEPATPIFKRLAEENVFAWVFTKAKEHIFLKSTSWIDKNKLKEHKEAKNVIYYLADAKKRQLYVGSARILGKRVKPGRSEIPGWNKFRYDMIRPDFAKFLNRIEDHSIRFAASLLENKKNISSLQISEYKLVNRTWSKR